LARRAASHHVNLPGVVGPVDVADVAFADNNALDQRMTARLVLAQSVAAPTIPFRHELGRKTCQVSSQREVATAGNKLN